MTSILPENMEGEIIGKMNAGDVAYTLPWAMYALADRSLFINAHYPAQQEPGDGQAGVFNNCKMKIERTRQGITVYRDSIPAHQTYQPQKSMRLRTEDDLPVELV